MAKHRLLIVKENRDYCRQLGKYLAGTDLFEVLPPAHDGASAIERIAADRPGIVLMDVILPNIDGIDVLRRIKLDENMPSTKVIVLSSFVDDGVTKLLMGLGVAYIIHMPATNDTVLGRILDFGVQDQKVKDLAMAFMAQSGVVYRDEIITNYLKLIGVPMNLSGYQQLKSAIAYVVDQGRKQVKITQEVYVHVAALHGTKPKRVERNIRTAIEAAWEHGDIKWQHKLFGYTVNQMKGRPTNKEFIAMVADRTIMRMYQP